MTAPSLTGIVSSVTFAENLVNATSQLLDADVVFSDAEGNFNGGNLSLSGLLAEDRVSVRNEGSGPGQIGLSGVNVTFGGVTIGTLAGGVGATLTITFNGSATSAAIDALIQNLTYGNVSDNPTANRTLLLNVTDAAGERMNQQPPSYTEQTGINNPLNGIDVGRYSNPTFIDLDGDGDLDAVVGNVEGGLLSYRNDGSSFSQLTGAANPFDGVDVNGSSNQGYSAPEAVDIDSDGDLDLVVGERFGTLLYFRDNGTSFGAVTGAANPFNGLDFGDFSVPEFVDLDGDNDMDLVVGLGGAGGIRTFLNTAGSFAEVTGASNPLNGLTGGQYSAPAFIDFDGDGDRDMVVGTQFGTLLSFRNNGGSFTALTGASNPFNGVDVNGARDNGYATPEAVDIDGDGDLDLVVGASDTPGTPVGTNVGGLLFTFENTAASGAEIIVTVTPEAEVPVNTAPTLAGVATSVTFGENLVNATPQLLDSDVVFADAEGNFNLGTLTVTGLLAEDIVSVRNEGNGAGQIGLSGANVTFGGTSIGSLAGGAGGTLTITFNGSATSAAIDAVIQNLTYGNGSNSPTESRTLSLNVTDAAGASLASAAEIGVTVTDETDTTISIEATDLDILEGDGGGTTTYTFTVTRTGVLSDTAQVDWALTGLLGLNAADFTSGVLPSGTVTFTGGEASEQVTFSVRADATFEQDEDFTITLSNLIDPAGGPTQVIGTSSVTGTILSDDGVYQLFADAASATVLLESNDFATVDAAATTGQVIRVADAASLGNVIQDLDVTTEDLTVISDAPFFEVTYFLAAGLLEFTEASAFSNTLVGPSIFGNAENNILRSGDGTNFLTGLSGNDSLFGGANNDSLFGDADNDLLNGGTGDDQLTGGTGNDTYFVDSASDLIFESSGQGTDDRVAASVSFSLAADDDIERLTTTSNAGTTAINLRGNALAQATIGNAGANVLNDGGFGASDTLTGLGGNDTYIVNNAGTIVVEGAGQGTLDRVATSVSFVLASDDNIEVFTTSSVGGTNAINLTGNALAQTITGNAGANTLNDGGGAGIDNLVGLGGNDTYVLGNSGAIIVEAAGGGTADRVKTSVSFTLAADDDIEVLETTNAALTTAINLTGNALTQAITGNDGANVLSDGGAGGDDTLAGRDGNDTYIVRNSGAIIVELAGDGTADRVATGVSFTLAADDDIELFTTSSSGGTTAINLTGNALSQSITGNAGANVLSDGGGAGADTMTGLGGNDTYIVRNAGTVIVEGAGQGTNDRVAAGVSFVLATDDNIETLTTTSNAGTGAINLTGNALSQTITGNAGANRINGLGGNDTLTGGGGSDTFVFTTALGATNIDEITDFNVAADTIELENAIFTVLATGTLTAAAFRLNATGLAGDATDRIIYDSATGNLYFDADGTGATARVQFAVLDAGLVLTNLDFLVV